MALSVDWHLVSNLGDVVTITAAYVKVGKIDATKLLAVAHLDVYRTSALGPVLKTDLISFVPNMDSSNFFEQAYDYAKTLPKYSGAVDC
jgi:hypothetical protein